MNDPKGVKRSKMSLTSLARAAQRWAPTGKTIVIQAIIIETTKPTHQPPGSLPCCSPPPTNPYTQTEGVNWEWVEDRASQTGHWELLARDADAKIKARGDYWARTFQNVPPRSRKAERNLLGTARQWPFDQTRPPTSENYANSASKARDAHPGLDTLPPAAWAHGGRHATRTLYDSGQWLASGRKMALGFNQVLNVFPPKGDPEIDKVEIVREGADTRPLGLKDSGNKAVANTCARSFSSALCRGACPLQNGFTPGRQFLQHLVDLDTTARAFGVSRASARIPVLASWDYAAACPSVAHSWIRVVLPVLAFPGGFQNVICGMYTLVHALGIGSSGLVFLFWILSGVLQGCPLSGLVFVAAIDPILWRIHDTVDARGIGTTRACADGIGAAMRGIAGLLLYRHTFALGKAAAGLALKPAKCALTPTAEAWSHV